MLIDVYLDNFYPIRYSTGSNLNTYSALIQNFYSQETAPHQAVHVALNTGIEAGEQAGVKAYVRCDDPESQQIHYPG